MDYRVKHLIIILLTAVMAKCALGTACPASPICDASSVAESVVSAALTAAVDGDTINLPAGSATWGSVLTITKAVSIIGAGNNLTHITRGAPGIMSINLAPSSASTLVRISGIYFDCVNWSSGDGGAILFPFNNKAVSFRIDHCTFNKGKRSVYPAGWDAGVIDHCTFINCNIAVAPSQAYAPEANDGDNSWARTVALGTSDAVFIEDCNFIIDSGAVGFQGGAGLNEQLYGWLGGRAVFRHNVVTSTFAGPVYFIDAHGPIPLSHSESTCIYEVYENTFNITNATSGRLFHLRGGRHIFYNNTITSDFNGLGVIALLHEIAGNPQVSPHQIADSYFYNNTFNGSQVAPYSEDGLEVLNTDYFNHAPQTGQTFFPYSAYTYPHPLAGASPTPTPAGFPVIVSQPLPLTINVGQVPTLSVQIGSTSLTNTFQWKKNGSNIGSAQVNGGVFGVWNGPNGSTASVLTDSGDKYSCAISNSAGSVTSNEALLTVLPTPPLTLPTWNSTEGSVQSPFVRSGTDYVWQSVTTAIDPSLGGSGLYPFTVVTEGDYWITGNVNCKDNASNSFFVNMDAEPTALMAWQIPTTTGFEDRDVIISPETTKHLYHLIAGTHMLYFRGREAEAQLGDITVTLVAGPTPTPTPTATPQAALPMFSPVPTGTPFITSASVTLSNAQRGSSTMHFTLTGEDLATADPSHILTYSTPVPLVTSGLIKAVTSASGFTDSPQATSQNYEIKVANPLLASSTGSFTATGFLIVTITDATPLSNFNYSTDGTDPPVTPYGVPVTVNASCTFKAQSKKMGCTDSSVVSQAIVINTPSPTPTPTATASATPTPTVTPPAQTFSQWGGDKQ